MQIINTLFLRLVCLETKFTQTQLSNKGSNSTGFCKQLSSEDSEEKDFQD